MHSSVKHCVRVHSVSFPAAPAHELTTPVREQWAHLHRQHDAQRGQDGADHRHAVCEHAPSRRSHVRTGAWESRTLGRWRAMSRAQACSQALSWCPVASGTWAVEMIAHWALPSVAAPPHPCLPDSRGAQGQERHTHPGVPAAAEGPGPAPVLHHRPQHWAQLRCVRWASGWLGGESGSQVARGHSQLCGR